MYVFLSLDLKDASAKDYEILNETLRRLGYEKYNDLPSTTFARKTDYAIDLSREMNKIISILSDNGLKVDKMLLVYPSDFQTRH